VDIFPLIEDFHAKTARVDTDPFCSVMLLLSPPTWRHENHHIKLARIDPG